jgi:hypothetical protein
MLPEINLGKCHQNKGKISPFLINYFGANLKRDLHLRQQVMRNLAKYESTSPFSSACF